MDCLLWVIERSSSIRIRILNLAVRSLVHQHLLVANGPTFTRRLLASVPLGEGGQVLIEVELELQFLVTGVNHLIAVRHECSFR